MGAVESGDDSRVGEGGLLRRRLEDRMGVVLLFDVLAASFKNVCAKSDYMHVYVETRRQRTVIFFWSEKFFGPQ